MKYFFTLLTLLTVSFANAQAFEGKGDQKFQVGVNFQNHATGINLSYDHGLGENFSIGLASGYALGVDDAIDADFKHRFDLKARFNANLGNVIGISDAFDLYPGLSLSLKNFGGHVGARYFFSDGFGVFSELQFPIAKYDTGDLLAREELYNQVSVNLGVSFNL